MRVREVKVTATWQPPKLHAILDEIAAWPKAPSVGAVLLAMTGYTPPSHPAAQDHDHCQADGYADGVDGEVAPVKRAAFEEEVLP